MQKCHLKTSTFVPEDRTMKHATPDKSLHFSVFPNPVIKMMEIVFVNKVFKDCAFRCLYMNL